MCHIRPDVTGTCWDEKVPAAAGLFECVFKLLIDFCWCR